MATKFVLNIIFVFVLFYTVLAFVLGCSGKLNVLGCGVLGTGIWMHLAFKGFSKLFISHSILSVDILIVIAGVLTFLLGFLGCCGSWFQSKCLLRMYFVLVITILLLEFTAATLGFVYRRDIGAVFQDELLLGIQNRYSIDNQNGLKSTWDGIQDHFKCCGVKSYQDWYHISSWPDKEWVPSSCCLPKYSNISSCGAMEDPSYFYQSGCYPKIHQWIMVRLYIVGIVCLVFTFLQIFGIIAALIVVCSLSPKQR